MILALESSCDESAIALFDPVQGMVGEWVHSQIAKHQVYGGVVPDIASREHLRHFPSLLAQVRAAVPKGSISRIAVTTGPGLAGCLALGISLGHALAQVTACPLVGVNHLRGHLYSPFIELHAEDPATFNKRLDTLLPHLGLVVSGGNTLLVEINQERHLTVLARTVDDAAGEALDKGAKLLGMAYPGGPLIEAKATGGDTKRFPFPRPARSSTNRSFSFSGLKTSLRYLLEKLPEDEVETSFSHICASYQQAVIDALTLKTEQALNAVASPYQSLGLSGGVANNRELRKAFQSLARSQGIPLFIAEPRHTGDNAGIIAFAAHADPTGLIQPVNGLLSFDPTLAL